MCSQLKWNQNKHKHTQFTFSFPPESDWSFESRPLRYILVPLSSATHLREGRAMSFPTQNRKAVWWISPIKTAVYVPFGIKETDSTPDSFILVLFICVFCFFSFGLCKMCLCCMFSTFPVWRDGLKTVSSVKPESFLKRTLEAILEALSLDSSWRDV